jgi:hypothetical protein
MSSEPMSKFTEIILRCYKYLDKVPLPKLDCHTSVNIANYNKTTSIFLNIINGMLKS